MSVFDEETKRYFAIINEIKTQSDRAAAIITAEFVSDQLRWILDLAFIESMDEKIKVGNSKVRMSKRLYEGYGPLSSFSSRIDICYSLGLMGTKTLNDLHLIRKIRNKFAHMVEPINFSTVQVQDLCNNLWYPKKFPPLGKKELAEDPREKYVSCAFTIHNFIRTEAIKKDLMGYSVKPKPNPIVLP